ncbi:MAG: hypothetical protein RIQ72_195, partial [Candidatus Parcubacteria bacterium]
MAKKTTKKTALNNASAEDALEESKDSFDDSDTSDDSESTGKKGKKDERSASIADTIAQIKTKFGDDAIMKLGEKPKVNINSIPTG